MLNLGKNESKTQIRKNTYKEKERLRKLFIRPNVKQKEIALPAEGLKLASLDVSRRDDRQYLLKIAKRMVNGNQFIISEQCTRNDDVVLAVSDEGTKVA